MPSKRPQHKTKTLKAAPSKGDSIRHNWKWQKYSRRMRDLYPLCMAPYHEGPPVPSQEVHHIKPLATHPHLAFVHHNTIPVCCVCHVAADSYRGGWVNWEGGSQNQKWVARSKTGSLEKENENGE
jgi:hypothetical protein